MHTKDAAKQEHLESCAISRRQFGDGGGIQETDSWLLVCKKLLHALMLDGQVVLRHQVVWQAQRLRDRSEHELRPDFVQLFGNALIFQRRPGAQFWVKVLDDEGKGYLLGHVCHKRLFGGFLLQ